MKWCGEWRNAKDELPEAGEMVLVVASGKPTKNVTLCGAYELAEYDPEGWILEMWPEWMDVKVSYWMHLPGLPE